MKKFLLIVFSVFILVSFANAAHAQTDSDKNFTCTKTLGVGNWECNVTLSSLPTGCTDHWTLGGNRMICTDLAPLLRFTYCRGGTEYNAMACGPDQQAADQAIVKNLQTNSTPGKINCQLDPSYPGGAKIACIPIGLEGCITSRYGGYTICNNYPPGCTPGFSSDSNGGAGNIVASCDLPTAPDAPTPAATDPCTDAGGGKLAYCPLEPLPGLENVQDLNFAQFLGAIFKLLIIAGALLAVGTLVYAGISYILSEAFETKGEAKRRMLAALWGLVILLGAWLILNTINPTLLNFNLSNLGVINSGTPSPQGAGAVNRNPTDAEVANCRSQPGHTIQYQPDGTWRCAVNR